MCPLIFKMLEINAIDKYSIKVLHAGTIYGMLINRLYERGEKMR